MLIQFFHHHHACVHVQYDCSCLRLQSVCALRVCAALHGCAAVHTYNPQRYGVSKAALNNAESLRLTTEQTQWGLTAQDIPFCIVLCCTVVPSHIHYISSTVEEHADKDCPRVTLLQQNVLHRMVWWFYHRTHEDELYRISCECAVNKQNSSDCMQQIQTAWSPNNPKLFFFKASVLPVFLHIETGEIQE